MDNENMLKAEDVARLLGGCNVQTVYKMAADGVIVSYKIGKFWRRFKAEDVQEFINRNREKRGAADVK